LNFSGKFLHELIVDADVGQGHADGSGARADRHAEQRVEKQQTDQRAPEASGHRTHGSEMVSSGTSEIQKFL
jgi:hypothetical protein